MVKLIRLFLIGTSLLLMSLPAAAQADIFRWDNGQLIPGTEGITPGPQVDFSTYSDQWSSPERNLRFADFTGGLDLTQASFSFGWLDHSRFNGANLTNAILSGASLTSADLSGTDLTDADLGGAHDFDVAATLTNANFTGAIVTGASLGTPSFGASGFTSGQLYSTASYRQKDLRGIGLNGHDLTGWDFSGQNLANANLEFSTLTNANFSFADLRGAYGVSEPIQLARNAIRVIGAINGLDLAAGETLIVRDSDIGITVNDSMSAVSGGTLELVLGDANWGSTMSVAAGIAPDLGGTLRVRFADQANLASMLGTTFDFFKWTGVLQANNRFDAIELPPGTQWDLNQLYVTGTAQLTAIPEPSTVLLFACGIAACAIARRRILANRRRQGAIGGAVFQIRVTRNRA